MKMEKVCANEIRITLFTNDEECEESVNKWLSEQPDNINVLDIKYQYDESNSNNSVLIVWRDEDGNV